MQNILEPTQRDVLREFAASNVLLAFDYDGTLTPIVDEPERAFMAARTRELLSQVARLYRTIVISGRAQPDALRRLRGVGVFEVVGNHGLEPWCGRNDHLIEQVQGWRSILEEELLRFDGVQVEDKIFSLSVHYRRSVEKKKARSATMRLATELVGARITAGKQVINIVPEGAPHKGIALLRERRRLGCDRAIYVGDDETDEDVFALVPAADLLGIRVGAKRASAARFYIPRQKSMDALLRALLEQRPFKSHYNAASL